MNTSESHKASYKLVCISGSSGVGKTTVSTLMQAVLGSDQALIVSGDDLHRWPRGDKNWEKYTHLHPNANNLSLGFEHLLALKNGQSILRSLYNHDTGQFDAPQRIEPKNTIIYEGLHALYDTATLDISDLNIFVDTDINLKTEWKIRRDTKKRGYSTQQVLDMLQRRELDELRYVCPQKQHADVIVKFTKNEDSNLIDLHYACTSNKGEDFMQSVKNFYDSIKEFLHIANWLALDPHLTQGAGGNISIKIDQGIIIKSSGFSMNDINLYHGYCLLNCDAGNFPKFESEQLYMQHISNAKRYGEGKPSMESGFHITLPNRVVVHSHPVHLNAILCSSEAKTIIQGLFRDLKYKFVEYVPPGVELSNVINAQEGDNIIFLQNHGLIIGTDSRDYAIELTEKINNKCKRWLGTHIDPFVDHNDLVINQPLFPDAAVFPHAMKSVNDQILQLIKDADLTPNFLTHAQITHLNNLTAEKFRRQEE